MNFGNKITWTIVTRYNKTEEKKKGNSNKRKPKRRKI